MKTGLILTTLTFLALSSASGQTLRDLFNRQNPVAVISPSPLAIIEMMERQLSNEFKGKAASIASHTTAKLVQDGKILAYGTVINGRDSRFSYLLCPADSIGNGEFVIQTQDGNLHSPLANASINLLSDGDNLAIIRLARLNKAISTKARLNDSMIGSFVGILGSHQSWKTGAVTNSNRSAFTSIDPGTQRALSKHWERIGLQVNKKRSGYPEVIETDLNISPSEAGSPVFDRSGEWQGIAIARADQHSTLVIPAKRIASLITEFEMIYQ
ncbi:MAG: hypothetical protein P1U89_00340 [Verrucomicrobiales bacterium]|nr:hypothetical protein [Verrucomicrobiales bacterium]